MEAKVNAVAAVTQVRVACDTRVSRRIVLYVEDLGTIVQKCLNIVSCQLLPRLLPLAFFSASVELF